MINLGCNDHLEKSFLIFMSLKYSKIRWSIYRPPYFQLTETHKNKKVHLLGFNFLPDDHYNLNLSSGEKVNPQKCFIYSYETWEFEKEVVDL